MYTLYHNLASTCSQKVRWAFAEKQVSFESKEIDLLSGEHHQPWYVALNPNHVVPTLVDDGEVIVESSLIVRYIDDKEGASLVPVTPLARYRVGHWMQFVDHVHEVAPVITFALGPRKLVNALPAEVREANIAAIPDPLARAQRRSVLDLGIKAPEFRRALDTFIALLDRMETTLQHSPWLAGDAVSLAEGSALPYVLRLEHLSLDPLIASRPSVANWFARMKARDSYAEAVDRWMPQALVDMLRTNSREEWPDIEAMLAQAS